METEATERASAAPVLSINTSAVLQVFDWTGKVRGVVNGYEYCYIYIVTGKYRGSV